MNTTSPRAIRSFVAWVRRDGGERPADPSGPREPGWIDWRGGALRVRYAPRDAAATDAAPETLPTLMLGDGSEWRPDERTSLAHGVPLRFEDHDRTLRLETSIVGLPPVFAYENDRVLAIASDVHALRSVPGVRLEIDPRSALELGRIGHPVQHRTLFRDLRLLPSGAEVDLRPDGTLDVRDAWSLPVVRPVTWPEFIEAQIAAFVEAVGRMDVAASFLSLTAGLDTRTVFATLAAQDSLIPAATMTGTRWSLDARAARHLCRAYGVPHHAVVFDDSFSRRLPDYVETASLLSGGLSSLDQAPEVYMYDQLGGAFAGRLSGNLGNQVGRGGTEGVSTRGADTSILAPDLENARSDEESGHWLLEHLNQDQRAKIEFILKNEIVLTLVNNFPIGNHFALQRTPYASRALIETLALRPDDGASAPSASMLRMRLRDVGHRFLGEPAAISFQRTLLRRFDGVAAHYPINWGWRARGGVSPVGLGAGLATLFGMYARARGWDGGPLRKPLAWSGLPALHDFRESRRWLRTDLRDFVHDVLRSQDTRALFRPDRLERVLGEHYERGVDHYDTITFALDLALAQRTFVA